MSDKDTSWAKLIVPRLVAGLIITAFGGILGGLVTRSIDRTKLAEARKEADEAKRQANEEARKKFYSLMSLHLRAARDAFENQCVARDRLVMLLTMNHGPLPDLEYEPLFREFYPEMNEEERVLFQMIRGITKTALRRHNTEMLRLIEENPQFVEEIADLTSLHEHLDLWLSKCEELLSREDVGLVYVGVEEEKPFPPGINEQIDAMVAKLESRD